MDLVSVVVPCYNSSEYVEDTLESIAQQTHRNLDIVLVEDGGTDNTIEILRRFSRQDKRFRIVRHRANSGLSAARNSGARAAFGKYLCFLDSDDLMMPESVQVRLSAIKTSTDPRIIGSYCGSLTIGEDIATPPPARPNPRLQRSDFMTSFGRCPFNANQPMFIKSEFLQMGGFDETLKQAEDYDLWMRILRAGFHIVPAKFDAVTYRARQSSMIRENPLQHAEYSSRLQRTFYEELGADGEYKVSPAYHHKAGQDYLFQSHNYNRILEFAGMAIGKDEPLEQIVEFIVENLPDVLTFHGEQRFRERLRHGVARYFANDAWLVNSRIETIDEIVRLTGAQLARERADWRKTPRLDGLGLTWFPGRQRSIDILFFPHKDYHVWTINLLRPALERSGVSFAVVDLTAHYRDEGVRRKAVEVELPLIGYGNFVLGDYQPRLLVAFNDWDPMVRSIFASAQAAGIATAAIVEGIQDYMDADTGRIREAYRSSDLVLVPGEHDLKYFEDSSQDVRVGGVPRIAELMRSASEREAPANPRNERPIALINSNFSYGVLVEHRDAWVESAVRGAESAGLIPIISRHPADLGETYPELVSGRSFYEDLAACDVVVQRFASGILEALAVDKSVVYFNPHNEKVDKFKSPNGAFRIAKSTAGLKKALRASLKVRPPRQAMIEYLDLHCNASSQSMLPEIVNDLSEYVAARTRATIDYPKFKNLLLAVDRLSGSLSDVKILHESLPATFGNNGRSIEHVFSEKQEILHDSVNCPALLFAEPTQERAAAKSPKAELPDTASAQIHSSLYGRRARPLSRRSALLSKLARDPYRYFKDSDFAAFRVLRHLFRPTDNERSAFSTSGPFIESNAPLSSLSMSARDTAEHFNALFEELRAVDARLRRELKIVSNAVNQLQEGLRTLEDGADTDNAEVRKYVAAQIRELDWKVRSHLDQHHTESDSSAAQRRKIRREAGAAARKKRRTSRGSAAGNEPTKQ